MGVLKFLFKKVPSSWWRKGLQIFLVSACSFYLLNIAMDLNIVERYTTLLMKSYFWRFVTLQVIVTLVFYVLLDFLLRIIFHKVLKKRIMSFHEIVKEIPRFEYLKSLTEIKNAASSFVMGFPVELGYINRQEIREIALTEINGMSEAEKEDALNEIVKALNKWVCVLIHWAITMLVVYHYEKSLMIPILIVGFVVTIIVFSVIILLVKNIELFELVLKELRKRV
jgi:hypothetical protein